MIQISDSESDSGQKDTFEPDTIYEVEEIIDHRRSQENSNQVEYFIKWKDYGHETNTWEKEKDIYSKGLINEYWKNKPYTLLEFKNKVHLGKEIAIGSKRKAGPSFTQKAERRQIEKEIRSGKMTSVPLAGYTWKDIEAIENVYFAEPSAYFAQVKWKNSFKYSFIPTRIIKKNNPLKLLEFYETKLDYYIPTATSD